MRKTIFMGLALSLATAAAAVAQGPGGQGGPPPGGEMRRGGPGMMMDQLFQGITLSDAQKTQIHQLFTADSAEREAGRAAMRAQMDSMRSAYQSGDTAKASAIRARGFAAMQQHMQEETNAVRNVLTADQRVQFDKNVAAMKERMQQRRGPGGMGGPPGGRDHQIRGPRGGARGLFRGITLTDAQKTQLRTLRESNRGNLRSSQLQLAEARVARLKGDTAQARSLRSQAFTQIKQQRQLQLAAVRNVLTADQRTQFDRNLQDVQLRSRDRHRGRGGWGGRGGSGANG